MCQNHIFRYLLELDLKEKQCTRMGEKGLIHVALYAGDSISVQ